MSDLWTACTIAALALITVLTRSFFFLSERPWTLPRWVQRGLQYAPIAALVAVIEDEEMVMIGYQMLFEGWGYRVAAAASAEAIVAAT